MSSHDLIAFAGAGPITAVHALAVQGLATHRGRLGARVVAVASRTMPSAEAVAAAVGAAAVGYDELPGPAGTVLVATPPDHHLLPALEAMADGVAVIVEVPLTARLADADRLVRAVAGGADLAYAEHLLFSDAVTHARSAVGAMGDITHCSARARRPRRPGAGSTTPAGGALLDVGSHVLAVVLRCLSRRTPTAVRAVLEGDPHAVDVAGHVEIRFDDGLIASVETGWHDDRSWDLQVAGSTGVVRLELEPDLLLEIDGDPVPLAAEDPGDLPASLLTHGHLDLWAESLASFDRHESPGVSDVLLGRDVLELVHAAYASAGTGDWVTVPLGGDRTLLPHERWGAMTP